LAKTFEEMKKKALPILFEKAEDEVKSLQEILKASQEPREIFVPELGCKIKLGRISMKEFTEISKIKDPSKLATEMLYRMWKAADSSVTREGIEALGFDIITAIVTAITGGERPFLLTPTE